ncbi:MAG TPA: hypothetical protein VJJ82_05100 [Candidatus Nanoarchaeia archaeon]|nr:hypothetical protein [Candidatus Nanoarchaeia archaeon]
MDYRPAILALAQATPLLPGTVAKNLKTDSIMAGAMLSEMCSKGMLKISALRVGGSPLYYIPGREDQLLRYLQSLNEKDRRTVEFLRLNKVVRETEVDALTRVSLSQIKDFAHPLAVSYENKQERFWKWFELKEDEAKEIIAQLLAPPKVEIPLAQIKASIKEVKEAVQEQNTTVIKEKESAAAKEKQTALKSVLKEEKKELIKTAKEENTGDKTNSLIADGAFWDKVQSFFKTNNIAVQESLVVKKKTEFDVMLDLPSPLGTLTYYCKVRSKKKIADTDLSAAFVQGQLRKLPILFITDGELSKSAKDFLVQVKGITIKQV